MTALVPSSGSFGSLSTSSLPLRAPLGRPSSPPEVPRAPPGYTLGYRPRYPPGFPPGGPPGGPPGESPGVPWRCRGGCPFECNLRVRASGASSHVGFCPVFEVIWLSFGLFAPRSGSTRPPIVPSKSQKCEEVAKPRSRPRHTDYGKIDFWAKLKSSKTNIPSYQN